MQVVTANRLVDGAVVYLGDAGRWVEALGHACVAEAKPEAEELMAQAERAATEQVVVGPYLIDVVRRDEQLEPLRYRERIRAAGPTVRLDLGKQAEQG